MESRDVVQQRDCDHDFVAAHSRCRAVAVYFGMTTQPISLHRLLTPRAHLLVVRPLIHDRRIRVGDVGDVRGFIHEGDVALGRNHGAADMLRPEFIPGNKRVLIRADVVITIRPIVDPTPAIEARFRRQWRPADVILARAPRNPGWRPFVARDPDPADAAESQPAAVVISRPAKRLVGNPGPTGVRISPAAIRIRSPPLRFFSHARLVDMGSCGLFEVKPIMAASSTRSVGLRRRGRSRRRSCRNGYNGDTFYFVAPGFLDVRVNRHHGDCDDDDDHQPHAGARCARELVCVLFFVGVLHAGTVCRGRDFRKRVNRETARRSRPTRAGLAAHKDLFRRLPHRPP
jgi:hypothetical protein